MVWRGGDVQKGGMARKLHRWMDVHVYVYIHTHTHTEVAFLSKGGVIAVFGVSSLHVPGDAVLPKSPSLSGFSAFVELPAAEA